MSGVVVEVGSKVQGVRVGERVTCGFVMDEVTIIGISIESIWRIRRIRKNTTRSSGSYS